MNLIMHGGRPMSTYTCRRSQVHPPFLNFSQADQKEKGDTPDKTTKISEMVQKVLKFDILLGTSMSGLFSFKK